MTTRLNQEDAMQLIDKVTTDCVNHLLDMRDMGAAPGDIMTALTMINTSVMAYVLTSAGTTLTTPQMIRVMAGHLRERVPVVAEAYQRAIAAGKEL
jgi:hypothetical protein